MREQLWLIPSGDPQIAMRATMFRPREAADQDAPEQRLPLVVINHGTDENTRLAVSMPVYYWLSRWFVERGYAVLLPQRRGHGATGGELAEAIGSCADPDHYASGRAAADDIAAAVGFMTAQPFIDPRRITVVGVSTGGWASLAYAARNAPNVEAVVNFAGGRGGHAFGRKNAICNAGELTAAARKFGETARIPSIWFYAKNDSYFGPELAQSLAEAWRGGGGLVENHVLQAYGSDGHSVADDRAGWDVWGDSLQDFLTRARKHRSGFDMAGHNDVGTAAPTAASDHESSGAAR
jgi:dienelactone hydrolase